MIEKKQLFLKPDEQHFISMAILDLIEQLTNTSNDQKLPWTPQARKDIKDMLDTGNRLKIKLEGLGFNMRPLPDFEDGDINTFFTKPS